MAVFYPLKFRSLMTTKQFVRLNGSTLLFSAIVYLFPIPISGFKFDGILAVVCDPRYHLSPLYYLFVLVICLINGSFIFFVNIFTGIGTVKALLGRSKLSHKKTSSDALLKVTLRILTICAINGTLNFPITLLTINISISTALCYMLAMSVGPLNVLVFTLTDPEFRERVKDTFVHN